MDVKKQSIDRAAKVIKEVEAAQKPETAWRKYCICKSFDDGSVMMDCGNCKEWFHPSCQGVDQNIVKPSDKWCCLDCILKEEGRNRGVNEETIIL